MAVNPVFINELRQSAFRRRPTVVVCALIIVAVILSVLAFLEAARPLVVYAPILIIPLIVPVVASGAVAKEYEQHTWLDLFLTRLTNAEVVYGKFGANILQVGVPIVALIPSLVLLLQSDYARVGVENAAYADPAKIVFSVITTAEFTMRLLLSACMCILLTMVCSRYSPNRRSALMWSYFAMAAYIGLGVRMWQITSALDYQYHVNDFRYKSQEDFQPINLIEPGLMRDVHLIFCGIVGIGSLFLLWISLSEQRGYRRSAGGSAIDRTWQPVGRQTTPSHD